MTMIQKAGITRAANSVFIPPELREELAREENFALALPSQSDSALSSRCALGRVAQVQVGLGPANWAVRRTPDHTVRMSATRHSQPFVNTDASR